MFHFPNRLRRVHLGRDSDQHVYYFLPKAGRKQQRRRKGARASLFVFIWELGLNLQVSGSLSTSRSESLDFIVVMEGIVGFILVRPARPPARPPA